MAKTGKTSWWWLLLFLIPIAAFVMWLVLVFSGNGNFNAKREVSIALAELKKDPNSFSANMRAGLGYYNLGLFNQSVDYYEKATNLDAASGDAWNNLGNTYRELLRYEDAELAYKRAVQLKPEQPNPYLNLAELYRRWPLEAKDRTSEIPTILESGLNPTKRDRAILHALVDYYTETGNQQKASGYQVELEAGGETNN